VNNQESYARAGVDLSRADEAKARIARYARATFRPGVIGGTGFFGGLFELAGYRQPVLVSSVDSVGTKLKIAIALDKHDTVGIDIVNHCVNDIFTGGAEPLFFLDYIAMGRLVVERVEALVQGLSRACREAGCALIGGETAELPGLYQGDDYDLVGFIIGVVEKGRVITGEAIAAGDAVIGLPSSGLHTNGYSLVRRVLGETRRELGAYYPELGRTLGEELLEPHRCYFNQLRGLLPFIKGMAHITGGGLPGNVPRVLPEGLAARFESKKWEVPPIFRLVQARGNVARDEMYRVFNMGLGMVVVCAPEEAGRFGEALPESRVVGEVVRHNGGPRVIID